MNVQGLATEMLQIRHGRSHEIVTCFYTDNAGVEFQKKIEDTFWIASLNTVTMVLRAPPIKAPKIAKSLR